MQKKADNQTGGILFGPNTKTIKPAADVLQIQIEKWLCRITEV